MRNIEICVTRTFNHIVFIAEEGAILFLLLILTVGRLGAQETRCFACVVHRVSRLGVKVPGLSPNGDTHMLCDLG